MDIARRGRFDANNDDTTTMTTRSTPEDDATIPTATATDGDGDGGGGDVDVDATTSQQQTSPSSCTSAAAPASAAKTDNASSSSSSCRIYLKDVNPTLDHGILKSKIRSLFEEEQKHQQKDDGGGKDCVFLLSVKEVFLSDRNPKKHYGFVTFETPKQAQVALDMLSSSTIAAAAHSNLFKQATPANSVAPRNQQRQKTIQQFAIKVKEYDGLYRRVSTSRIILQVHKSHYERYRHFILDYFSNLTNNNNSKKSRNVSSAGDNNPSNNLVLNVSVDHHHVGKSTTFLFVAISSLSSSSSSSSSQSSAALPSFDDVMDDLVKLLETKWYMQRDLGRIICRPPPNHQKSITTTISSSAAEEEGTGIVQASSLQKLAQQVLHEIIDRLSSQHDDETIAVLAASDRILKVRIHIYPPKLRNDLLDCIHDCYDDQLAAIEAAEAATAASTVTTTKEGQPASTTAMKYQNIPLSRIQLSPTNAQYELTVTCFHEGCDLPREAGTTDIDDDTTTSSSSNHIRPALYLIGQLESTEKTENESRSSATAADGRNNLDVTPSPTAKRQKLAVDDSGVYDQEVSKGNSHAISRAYWKLQEAWERYPYETPPIQRSKQTVSSGGSDDGDSDNSSHSQRQPPIVALDCGASPGGWVKFLLDKYSSSLKRIYAIDPGALDETVQQASVVDHVKATIQKSWTYLVEDVSRCTTDQTHRAIDIWVSDMCVKDMPVQVDIILDALERGLIGSKNLHRLNSTGENVQRTPNREEEGPRRPSSTTFFVLTLKCFVGHSMQTFDNMAEEQAERLRVAGAQHLFVLHLFSNRRSERTIMGYF